MKPFLVLATALLLSACTDAKGARRVLEDAGYQQVRTTGYALFGCGEGDVFHTAFEATAPSGRTARGVVCSGWFKGRTIRLK